MDITNEQLERIWKQIDAGIPYPGWLGARRGTIDVLSGTVPEMAWTRMPPDGTWGNAPTPAEAANSE